LSPLIFDVVARIEAKQSGKPVVPGGGGRFPSTPRSSPSA